jgi:hypothetical protein
MPRERRSLWGSISQSKKVNRVSLKAALLFSWSIPHMDQEILKLTLSHSGMIYHSKR